ncbi:MAG: asparagine synthetase B family protein [Flavobacteriaceae bacterium]|nr:asparagine synthetase B family protein [Flavobacteriaceae bacterium]
MDLRLPIIPSKQTFAPTKAPQELHLEAICIFAAIGFFLDQDTYYKDKIVLSPGFDYSLDENGFVNKAEPFFNWFYKPQDDSFESVIDQFTNLFESIIAEQTASKKVILPLSGGLDSRTQAVALKQLDRPVFSYSYDFENGYEETKIAEAIAKASRFEFQAFKIKSGYLWDKIDSLSQLNGCYSDFTNPRQMAIFEEYSGMGDVFSLGHWGDVLFDNMNLPDLSHDEQLKVLKEKLIKRGGLEIASDLWRHWGLKGDFQTYLSERISTLMNTIKIDNTNARLRAFKSKYWAPRWTSINLSVFEAHAPISLPYYDDRMCNFICTVPERFLQNRQIQLEYVKRRSPDLAKICWQDHRPYNLNNYKYNRIPFNLPYRMKNKLKRMYKKSTGSPYVQRNWELQFKGNSNITHLKKYLFENGLDNWVSKDLIRSYFNAFLKEDLQHAHAINMLLVLSKFNEKEANG